jgi:hypothetical protein
MLVSVIKYHGDTLEKPEEMLITADIAISNLAKFKF